MSRVTPSSRPGVPPMYVENESAPRTTGPAKAPARRNALLYQPLGRSARPWLILLVLLTFIIVPLVLVNLVHWATPSNSSDVVYRDNLNKYDKYMHAAQILDAIGGLLMIPMVSALIAYAAVVYSQRRSHKQKLSFLQLISLSNRDWLTFNPTLLHKSAAQRSWFLTIAAIFVAFCFLILPLRHIILPLESRRINICEPWTTFSRDADYGNKWTPRCEDLDYRGNPRPDSDQSKSIVLGREGEITGTRLSMESSSSAVVSRLAGLTKGASFPKLWREGSSEGDVEYLDGGWDSKDDISFLDDHFWVSSMNTGITTGPLRFHALRMNSSVECESVDDFPFSQCNEESGIWLASAAFGGANISACVPEDYVFEPTRDKQTLKEEVYLQVTVDDDDVGGGLGDMTVRCTAETLVGYFELGNGHNDWKFSEILDTWPWPGAMREKFHDYDGSNSLMTSEIPSSTFGESRFVRTPLKGAAMALFGPQSWFNTMTSASQFLTDDAQLGLEYCRTGPNGMYQPPFDDFTFGEDSSSENSNARYFANVYGNCTRGNMTVSAMADTSVEFMHAFAHPVVGPEALKAAMLVTTDEFLTWDSESYGSEVRSIINKTSTPVMLPRYEPAAAIAITVITGIQVLLLIALVIYAAWPPTWTDTLDAWAMVRLGASVKNTVTMPWLGRLNKDNKPVGTAMKTFENQSGVIGVAAGTDQSGRDIEMTPMPSTRTSDVLATSPGTGAAPGHARGRSSSDAAHDDEAPSYHGDGETAEQLAPPAYGEDQQAPSHRAPSVPYVLALGGEGLVNRRLFKATQSAGPTHQPQSSAGQGQSPAVARYT